MVMMNAQLVEFSLKLKKKNNCHIVGRDLWCAALYREHLKTKQASIRIYLLCFECVWNDPRWTDCIGCVMKNDFITNKLIIIIIECEHKILLRKLLVITWSQNNNTKWTKTLRAIRDERMNASSRFYQKDEMNWEQQKKYAENAFSVYIYSIHKQMMPLYRMRSALIYGVRYSTTPTIYAFMHLCICVLCGMCEPMPGAM